LVRPTTRGKSFASSFFLFGQPGFNGTRASWVGSLLIPVFSELLVDIACFVFRASCVFVVSCELKVEGRLRYVTRVVVLSQLTVVFERPESFLNHVKFTTIC
jgi:hypothetical protein